MYDIPAIVNKTCNVTKLLHAL